MKSKIDDLFEQMKAVGPISPEMLAAVMSLGQDP